MGQHPWGRGTTPGSRAQRKRILQRDPTCTCHGCPQCTPTGCGRPSTDDDHTIPVHKGGNTDTNDDRNHAGLCHPCHAHKSHLEANAARWALRERRPAERHPGLL